MDRLWGSRASGRGRAYLTTYKDIKNLLYSLDLHDVWIDPNLSMLQYYHRRLSGRDLYFFNNEGESRPHHRAPARRPGRAGILGSGHGDHSPGAMLRGR